MKRLIHSFISRSPLMITFIVLLLVWGGMAAWQIQRDYLPQINNSTLSVTVRAANYQASDVGLDIAKPIEQAVRVVDGLQDVETSSFNGGCLVSLDFPMTYDMVKAQAQVTKALVGISLPDGVQKPVVSRLSTNSLPIMKVSLIPSSANMTENTLRTAVQKDVADVLKTVPGVQDVSVMGGGDPGYAVTIRMEALKKAGLTLDDVKRSLEENHVTGLKGTISGEQTAVPVQITGWGLTRQDLARIPIHGHNGTTVTFSEIAVISNSIVNLQTISRTNGVPSVILDIMKTSSSNITDVSERIKSKMQEIPEIKNKDVKASILVDEGKQVTSSLISLLKEGLLGCLFSMICVFLFFRKVRSTVLIAVSLPICLLGTLGVLKTMGITLNILTVSGLIVAMGRVVDDSIVILDNMNRHVLEGKEREGIGLLAQAVSEMIPAIFSSTATTIAVYIPIALIGGMVGASFSGFAWSVVVALAISLLVSIIVVPSLYHLFWKGKPQSAEDHLESFSKKVLGWGFQRKKTVIMASVIVFLVSVAGAAELPVNFLPSSAPTGQIGIQVELPQGTSLAEVDGEVKRLEAMLKRNTKVKEFSSALGSSFTAQSDDVFDTGGGWIQKPNVANISVTARPGIKINELIDQLQNQLNSIQSKAIFTVTNQSLAGDDSQLKIYLTGSFPETLNNLASTISNQLKLIPGLAVEGIADQEDNVSGYQITLNRKAIEQNGLKEADILNRISLYTVEGETGLIKIDQTTIPVLFHSDTVSQAGTAGAATLPGIFHMLGEETFRNTQGKEVKLSDLATLSPGSGPAVIQEKDGHPFAVVTANITSPDISKVTKQVETSLGSIPLPDGVKYSFAGAPEQVNEMIYEMALALSFSVLFVLIIISAVFKGWKAPISVLICIPLAFAGSVIGLFITGKEWDLAALVGLLMLTGIVVTNGIVLVDKIERNRKDGMDLEEAVFKGTLSRIRPILTTAATTILTLTPLALSSSRDQVISQTLGIVVVGGLISSTLSSIMVVPILYRWFHRKTEPLINIEEKREPFWKWKIKQSI